MDHSNRSNSSVLSYGTSGFRYNHKVLIHHAKSIGKAIGLLMIRRHLENVKVNSCLKCEILPTDLHSKTVYLNGTWGVMITASHNPAEDNGVKIVDYDGKMVSDQEEKFLEQCVSGEISISDVFRSHYELIELNLLTIRLNTSRMRLAIGRDTRDSGPCISELVIQGVRSILPDCSFKHIGFCTTPEFHFITKQLAQVPIYSELAHALFARTSYVAKVRDVIRTYQLEYDLEHVMIDCANGVGFRTMRKICKNLANPIMINTGQNMPSKMLNYQCGSDYVENHSDLFLQSLSDQKVDLSNRIGCSFDGDADRIVFYYKDNESDKAKLKVMNGDHIISLILRYIVRALKKSNHIKHHLNNGKPDQMINIGVIYTPYANGGFISDTEKLAIDVYDQNHRIAIYRRAVPIGVKHLIGASQAYHIAIYFEPNGHGSVLINKDFGIPELQNLKNIFNQVIGDGILNLLGVIYILRELQMSPKDMHELFTPVQSHVFKIEASRELKSKIKMSGVQLIEPVSLINKVRELESTFDRSRIFIRPSGTEDVIRVYIEGDCDSDIQIMKTEISKEIQAINN